ncbi:ubiquitin domain-containing protein 1 [Amborella trichopoda]|uniref:ubiquitin domain-containing protein 1 n=1 Tax=Amborella trichopoda TaxID=13333 RepID=UPI0005D3D567|nr:ubiquitin domain-containing protein 1 [Amborella trichopoda]|eukprot:XP_011629384.1 ubiquitin domain-containing protein 1 [Amborella trichopoda]
MGCAGSSQKSSEGTVKKLRKPKPWKHTQSITRMQLRQMRDEFWDTAPHYGGQKEIWDALRAAAEADMSLAQAIVDSAGVIVTSADMSTCYDERAINPSALTGYLAGIETLNGSNLSDWKQKIESTLSILDLDLSLHEDEPPEHNHESNE